MKGLVSVAGALPFSGSDGQDSPSLLNMAGIRTGVDSRFIFETVTRQRDTLVAEFVARQDSPLTLSKVTYSAHINDWLSLVSVPLGARCQDFSFGSSPLQVIPSQIFFFFFCSCPKIISFLHICVCLYAINGRV